MAHVRTTHSSAQLPVEFQLLALLTQPIQGPSGPRISALVSDPQFDAAGFHRLAVKHRVESRVANNLLASRQTPATDTVLKLFAPRAKHLAQKVMYQEAETAKISKIFEQANLLHVLLKGASVAARYYPNRYERQYKDMDFLICKDQVLRAIEVLQTQGFRIIYPGFGLTPSRFDALRYMACDLAMERQADNLQIELHWRLETNPQYLPWSLDTAELQLSTILISGQEIPVICTAQQFVFLCCHGAKHSWFRLRWLVDICLMLEILSESDFQAVFAYAQEQGTERIIALALYLAAEVYGIKLNPASQALVREHLQPRSLRFSIESMVGQDNRTHIRMQDIGFIGRRFLFQCSLKPGWHYRISLFHRATLDPRDIGILGLSARWTAVYSLLSPFIAVVRLARRGWRT